MEFDEPMSRYFGTTEPGAVSAAVLENGGKRMIAEFTAETDSHRRFAMWTLMYVLGIAPDLETAFRDFADRKAARDFVDLLASVNDN